MSEDSPLRSHGKPGREGVGGRGARRRHALAAERAEQDAPQYIYESILEPGRFIAPACKDGVPCTEPSAMPECASLVSLEDVADMLAYLLQQGAPPPPITRPGAPPRTEVDRP